MKRQLLIQRLVIDSVERIQEYRHFVWINSLFEDGFIGFNNMSDDQLHLECVRRGLPLGSEDTDHKHLEDDTQFDSEDVERDNLIRYCRRATDQVATD